MTDNLTILDGDETEKQLATKELSPGLHLYKMLITDDAGVALALATEATLAALLAAVQKLAPASAHAAVTPSDETELAAGVTSLYVGGAGDLVVEIGGTAVTYVAVPAGTLLPLQAEKVLDTGTTATGIVAWF